ncbi:FAD dependent oxidoreductase-domain-containing protein [Aspergillus tamarii]|uniref:FAD dependent oxidoreductase-domain-containing protein n=1 Tax=Aspergillus tamarii TaxID=41984 RepID=A0A5N6UF68_ASPTM|nr:FAD dependent oxidoreductase-domain-containing protein [Aspergillus tamarii]
MAGNQIPHELLAKLAGQIIQDPGIPVSAPTVSAWQEPAHPIATIQSDELPQRTDFAIIGSGITGTSVAKTLLENGPARDKTSQWGFLLSHAPPFFKRYAEAFGTDAARQIALFCDRTLESIVDIAKAENLDKASQIRNVTTVASFEDEEGFADVTESIHTAEKEYHLKKSSGALVIHSRVFWPYRLVTTLLQSLLQLYPERFAIETHTPVISVTIDEADNEYPYILTTPRGTVRAAKVFHCTSGFTGHLLPKLRGAIFPCRLSMTTQKPGPHTTLVEQGLYWMQQNAETGDLFVGGDLQRLDDFLFSDDSLISADSARNLTDLLLKRLFKEGWTNPITNTTMSSTTALHRVWSGILSMTADQVPIVGSVPTSISGRNVEGGEWIAAGFNGYGMSQCWLCGEAIARMALGEPKPEWLPDVYLSAEKRLGDEASMGPEAALASFFAT